MTPRAYDGFPVAMVIPEHLSSPLWLSPDVVSVRLVEDKVPLSSVNSPSSTSSDCLLFQKVCCPNDPLTSHPEYYLDVYNLFAPFSAVACPMHCIRSASGVIDECARVVFSYCTYPAAIGACHALWIESANVDAPDSIVLLVPFPWILVCLEDISPSEASRGPMQLRWHSRESSYRR